MESFFIGFAVFIVLLFSASLYRIAAGRTIFDRIIGAGRIGAHAVLVMC